MTGFSAQRFHNLDLIRGVFGKLLAQFTRRTGHLAVVSESDVSQGFDRPNLGKRIDSAGPGLPVFMNTCPGVISPILSGESPHHPAVVFMLVRRYLEGSWIAGCFWVSMTSKQTWIGNLTI